MFSFDITGPTHPDTTYYIRYRGAVYADCGNFRKCILLWLYALDTQQQCLEPLHPMIQSSFLSFTELFQYMQKQLSPLATTATTSGSGGSGLGQRDAGQREPLSLGELSKFSAAERNSMCSVQSMYTATVLKILQQAVEEIKRGLMLLQQIQEKLPSLTSHSPSSSSSSSSSPSSPSSSKSPASQADELIAGMCFFFI